MGGLAPASRVDRFMSTLSLSMETTTRTANALFLICMHCPRSGCFASGIAKCGHPRTATSELETKAADVKSRTDGGYALAFNRRLLRRDQPAGLQSQRSGAVARGSRTMARTMGCTRADLPVACTPCSAKAVQAGSMPMLTLAGMNFPFLNTG